MQLRPSPSVKTRLLHMFWFGRNYLNRRRRYFLRNSSQPNFLRIHTVSSYDRAMSFHQSVSNRSSTSVISTDAVRCPMA